MNEADKKLRDHLVIARQEAMRDYDKTVLKLSAGAFGISFAFVRDLVPHPDDEQFLFWSWVCWGLSLAIVLISYCTSSKGLERAIKQIDDEDSVNRFGGRWNRVTGVLNFISGSLFIAGLGLITAFVWLNM